MSTMITPESTRTFDIIWLMVHLVGIWREIRLLGFKFLKSLYILCIRKYQIHECCHVDFSVLLHSSLFSCIGVAQSFRHSFHTLIESCSLFIVFYKSLLLVNCIMQYILTLIFMLNRNWQANYKGIKAEV